MKEIQVAISPGELLDKITILRIKSARMHNPTQLVNVRHELQRLEQTWHAAVPTGIGLDAEERALEAINSKLWDVEDQLRDSEAAQRFDGAFIALARLVYFTNDERAALKKRINVALGSELVEEKSYRPYQGDALGPSHSGSERGLER